MFLFLGFWKANPTLLWGCLSFFKEWQKALDFLLEAEKSYLELDVSWQSYAWFCFSGVFFFILGLTKRPFGDYFFGGVSQANPSMVPELFGSLPQLSGCSSLFSRRSTKTTRFCPKSEGLPRYPSSPNRESSEMPENRVLRRFSSFQTFKP